VGGEGERHAGSRPRRDGSVDCVGVNVGVLVDRYVVGVEKTRVRGAKVTGGGLQWNPL